MIEPTSLNPNFYHSIMNEPTNFNRMTPEELEFLSPSSQTRLYGLQSENYHTLKHIQEANKEELIFIVKLRARQLSDMTQNQAYWDLATSILRGGLSIYGVTQPENIQKLLMGIGEAFGQFSYMGKSWLDAKKIPIQTEKELLSGVEIPGLERQAQAYFDALRELKQALTRLTELEDNAIRSINQN